MGDQSLYHSKQGRKNIEFDITVAVVINTEERMEIDINDILEYSGQLRDL